MITPDIQFSFHIFWQSVKKSHSYFSPIIVLLKLSKINYHNSIEANSSRVYNPSMCTQIYVNFLPLRHWSFRCNLPTECYILFTLISSVYKIIFFANIIYCRLNDMGNNGYFNNFLDSFFAPRIFLYSLLPTRYGIRIPDMQVFWVLYYTRHIRYNFGHILIVYMISAITDILTSSFILSRLHTRKRIQKCNNTFFTKINHITAKTLPNASYSIISFVYIL